MAPQQPPITATRINASPFFESAQGWGPGYAKSIAEGGGVVIGSGATDPNVFAQSFPAKPNEQFKVVARASSVDKLKAKGRFQINWLGQGGEFISASIKAFGVTREEKTFEHLVSAPVGTVTGTLYVVSDGLSDVVRYTEMSLFTHILELCDSSPEPGIAKPDILPNTPPENCFPTYFIHTNDKWTRANWDYLKRGYADEAYIKESIVKIRDYTMVTHDGLLATYDICSYLVRANIEGAFVETGVHRGGSASMMALAALRKGKARELHLFDSFEGIPHPIEAEYEEWVESAWGVREDEADGSLVGSGKLAAEQHHAEKVLFDIARYPRELTTFHIGWFQDTVPIAKDSIGSIALLRLDGDLYESTLVCLRHFYPLVVRGGFVIVDDYAIKGCRMACDKYFEELGIQPYMHHIDHLARYFVKA